MAGRNNFIIGVTELLILSILKKSDNYVYGITQDIAKYSDGLLTVPQATIYTATYKLERNGYISEYSTSVGKNRIRVYYHIEASGLSYLDEISEIYRRTSDGVEHVFAALNNLKGDN